MAKFKVPFSGRNTVNITVLSLMHIALAHKHCINVPLAGLRSLPKQSAL
jgi:hypothetical protein